VSVTKSVATLIGFSSPSSPAGGVGCGFCAKDAIAPSVRIKNKKIKLRKLSEQLFLGEDKTAIKTNSL
jgi:hypothetical protein